MSQAQTRQKSLEDVHATVKVGRGGFFRKLFAFAGPAYLVSVGYMDPGNWATDIAGGSLFGYQLLWVLLMSNIMALLLQTLSARLGIVAGLDLAQACRERYSRTVSFLLWILCEVAIAACDLAEVIGTVIGLHLLFGLPMQIGVIITVFDTFLLLAIQRLGMRKMEAFILVLVFTIGMCFVLEILWAQPVWGDVLRGFIPTFSATPPFVFQNHEALYIAIGILGATVMPHNLYLHSALVQTRNISRDREGIRTACKYNFFDSLFALNAAFFVNAAILILAGAAFFGAGQAVTDIEEAHRLLPSFLGPELSSTLFALALLCAGQSSTLTGTLAGQIVMEGFVKFRMRPWMRRLVTRLIAILPAMVTVYWLGGENLKDLLILSQVVLSLQLSFAVVPLIQATSDKATMGEFANPLWVKIAAWTVAAVIMALNINLVLAQIGTWASELAAAGHSPLWVYLTAGPLAAGCGVLLAFLLVQPYLKRSAAASLPVQSAKVAALSVPSYKRIAVAVENKPEDAVALSHALGLARQHGAEVLVMHVVEGVGGQMFGASTQDREQREDEQYVQDIATSLAGQGVHARGLLFFGAPAEQLIQAVGEHRVDLIVLRSHGHQFLGDAMFGATIDAIRHAVNIPVLTVR